MTQYGLLAVDIDGTLVGPDQAVAGDVVEALAAARAEGLRVCLATGRSHAESVGIWRQLRLQPPFEPIILVGGAVVAEPDTGRTLYQRTIPWPVACELADALGERGHVAMVLLDAWRWGVDYLVTEAGDHDAAGRDWFSKMDVRVRRVGRLADVADPPEVLRISAVPQPARARPLAEQLQGQFDGRLNVQAILAPNYHVTIVEAHAAGATKMTALRYIAQGLRMPARRLAAVGDDINDLPMIRGAGLGAAMPHAPQGLLDAADHVARGGLAPFVRELLAGRFDAAP
jgi:Cof subfamily protein (haloacid dehalogenase superfamily)